MAEVVVSGEGEESGSPSGSHVSLYNNTNIDAMNVNPTVCMIMDMASQRISRSRQTTSPFEDSISPRQGVIGQAFY